MLISLLHPSRSRVERSKETTSKWLLRAGHEVELIVSIDENDPSKEEYIRYYRDKVIVNANRSAVDAINNAAKVAKGDILIVVSDDSDCPRNWVEKIVGATHNKRDWILKVNDGIQKWIITMPIMDRNYYERFGYIYYPEFLHLFCDTQLTHVADITKKIIKREDLNFPHLHYSVTRGKKDEVTIKADSTWEQGKKIYLKNCLENFGLGSNIDIFSISDTNHIRWLKNELSKYRKH